MSILVTTGGPVAGHLVWSRGLRGFVPSKRPVGYQPKSDEAPPVAAYPLNAEQYAMSIAILEQRFGPPKEDGAATVDEAIEQRMEDARAQAKAEAAT